MYMRAHICARVTYQRAGPFLGAWTGYRYLVFLVIPLGVGASHCRPGYLIWVTDLARGMNLSNALTSVKVSTRTSRGWSPRRDGGYEPRRKSRVGGETCQIRTENSGFGAGPSHEVSAVNEIQALAASPTAAGDRGGLAHVKRGPR